MASNRACSAPLAITRASADTPRWQIERWCLGRRVIALTIVAIVSLQMEGGASREWRRRSSRRDHRDARTRCERSLPLKTSVALGPPFRIRRSRHDEDCGAPFRLLAPCWLRLYGWRALRRDVHVSVRHGLTRISRRRSTPTPAATSPFPGEHAGQDGQREWPSAWLLPIRWRAGERSRPMPAPRAGRTAAWCDRRDTVRPPAHRQERSRPCGPSEWRWPADWRP